MQSREAQTIVEHRCNTHLDICWYNCTRKKKIDMQSRHSHKMNNLFMDIGLSQLWDLSMRKYIAVRQTEA